MDAENQWGCVASDTIIVTLTESVGINSTLFIKDNFQVFPNPTLDFFWVKNLNPSFSKIQLFDLFGKKLLEKEFEEMIKIPVKDFPKGIYFLKMKNEKERYVQMLIFE